MNQVSLTGRITHSLELKVTTQKVHVLSFTIAVDRRFSKDDEADFVDIECWRQSADYLSQYASKGTTIGVNGELRVEKFIGRDGNNRKKIYVLADNVEIISQPKSKEKTVAADDYSFNESVKGTEYADNFGGSQYLEDDDLPFY